MLIWLDDSHIPKQMLYRELAEGIRPQEKPKKHFQIVSFILNLQNWEVQAGDRKKWRKYTKDVAHFMQSQ